MSSTSPHATPAAPPSPTPGEDADHAPESQPHGALLHSTPPGRNAAYWALIVAGVAVVGCGVYFGAIVPRAASQENTARSASDSGKRFVNVMQPTPSPATTTVILPGTVRAWQQTDLFARTNGYIQKWLVDIGDPVKEGQILAVIDTPEIDQELKAALGDLAQAQANYDLASITERRWKELLAGRVSTPQEYDEKAGAMRAREADLTAAKAKVSRLQDLQAFQKVVAPFSGVVTARNAQVGALINSGSSSGTSPLFTIVQSSRLRVSVRVPQSFVRSISNGLDADLLVPEFRDRIFHGKVSRSANAMDDATRTLLTEVEVPNEDGALLPGMYANVRFAMRDAQPPMLIQANALQFRPEGPQVLLVDKDGKVEPRRVKLGRDYGAVVEITDGLALADRVIANPTYELTTGLPVEARLLPATDLKTAGTQQTPGGKSEINFKTAEKAVLKEERVPLLPHTDKH